MCGPGVCARAGVCVRPAGVCAVAAGARGAGKSEMPAKGSRAVKASEGATDASSSTPAANINKRAVARRHRNVPVYAWINNTAAWRKGVPKVFKADCKTGRQYIRRVHLTRLRKQGLNVDSKHVKIVISLQDRLTERYALTVKIDDDRGWDELRWGLRPSVADGPAPQLQR